MTYISFVLIMLNSYQCPTYYLLINTFNNLGSIISLFFSHFKCIDIGQTDPDPHHWLWKINHLSIIRGVVFRPPCIPPPAANLFVRNYIKKGGKGLKNTSFWVINSKNFLRPVRRKPFRWGKKSNCTIYTPALFSILMRALKKYL